MQYVLWDFTISSMHISGVHYDPHNSTHYTWEALFYYMYQLHVVSGTYTLCTN